MMSTSGALDHQALAMRVRELRDQREDGAAGIDAEIRGVAALLSERFDAQPGLELGRSTAYVCQQGSRAALRAGDADDSITLGRRAARVADVVGDADLLTLSWIEVSDALHWLGRDREAMEALAEANIGATGWTVVRKWSRYSQLLASLGQTGRAMAVLDWMDIDLLEATSRAPKPDWFTGLGDGWAANRRALTYKELGFYNRAVESFEEAAAAQSSDRQRAQLDTGRAECLAGLGRIDEAALVAADAVVVLDRVEDYREVIRIKRLHKRLTRIADARAIEDLGGTLGA